MTGFLLILFLLCHCRLTAGNDATSQDYLPTEPFVLLLPTTAGTVNIQDIPGATIGKFHKDYYTCGTHTVNSKDVVHEQYGDKHFEVRVNCRPHPMRIVTSEAPNAFSGQATPTAWDPQECQGVQKCGTTTDFTDTAHGKNTATPTKTLGGVTGADMCPSKNEAILLSNEEECEVGVGVPARTTTSGSSGAVKRLKRQSNTYYVAPRWEAKHEGFFEVLRSFTYQGDGNRLFPLATRTNTFLPIPKRADMQSTKEWRQCTATCDAGTIAKVTMGPGSWKMTLYVRGDTHGFKLCFGALHHDDDSTTPVCGSRMEMYVLVRNNLIIWPGNGRASIIQLRDPEGTHDDVIPIEIGYGFGSAPDGNLPAEIYVGNIYREVVTSDSKGIQAQHAQKISIFFQKDDNLIRNGGIVSQNIGTAKVYVKKGTPVKDSEVKNPEPGQSVAQGSSPLNNQEAETYQPVLLTTTEASPRIISNAASGALLLTSDNASDAIYMPGKWWAWALFIGFIIGSILGVSIIGGIFYVLRRTVYGFWYRGMYKRYGCDVSGTTAGITGVGFGNTTTGAITVGGTTGAGTTVGGTTTGGNTTQTGGGTTGSMTSTGGASTIAM